MDPRPAIAAEPTDAALLDALRRGPDAPAVRSHRLTRWVFLRALGFVYTVAFAIWYQQAVPLIGSHGLLPVSLYLERMHRVTTFWEHPTLFWPGASDVVLRAAGGCGLVLALLVLVGVDHVLILAGLWILYLSCVHVGQVFYGYGWETLLLETGFLAIFLGPVRSWSSARDRLRPSNLPFVCLAWLLFRVMFGAGLIKLRGDVCWRDLSCLVYHYETQPNPHPLSRVIHAAPRWFHQAGVLFNHFVELIAPWGLFLPRAWRHAAALSVIAFQLGLILSGNLSFLNWLTIAIALGCIDDAGYRRVLPARLVRFVESPDLPLVASGWHQGAAIAYTVVVALLSVSPITNMLSPHQRMNTSFDPVHLVNSYGAFGSIGRERDEVILQGTTDPDMRTARWKEYAFKCKPGDVQRAPCLITPYHYRLDWQMWFAALSDYEREPWLVHLIYKLLSGDRTQVPLMAHDPFPGERPRFIRAERYRYHFSPLCSRDYWTRQRVGTYLPALSLGDPRLTEFLAQYGLVRGKRLQLE